MAIAELTVFDRMVTAAIIRHNESSVGLSFVPNVVRDLMGNPMFRNEHRPELRKRIFETLISLARLGVIELRTDAGLGRFTRDELANAPPAPQSSFYLYTRVFL